MGYKGNRNSNYKYLTEGGSYLLKKTILRIEDIVLGINDYSNYDEEERFRMLFSNDEFYNFKYFVNSIGSDNFLEYIATERFYIERILKKNNNIKLLTTFNKIIKKIKEKRIDIATYVLDNNTNPFGVIESEILYLLFGNHIDEINDNNDINAYFDGTEIRILVNYIDEVLYSNFPEKKELFKNDIINIINNNELFNSTGISFKIVNFLLDNFNEITDNGIIEKRKALTILRETIFMLNDYRESYLDKKFEKFLNKKYKENNKFLKLLEIEKSFR